jgi:DNA mismatch repair protein MutL
MGFRGEAIPSIASISKFTLLTREATEETSSGTMLVVEGGKILQCSPVACNVGTTIEVKSLFFNVPARKKFQKAPAHDIHEIVKIVTSLALGHPHIQMQLISEQKTLLSSSPPYAGIDFCEALRFRIGNILGEQLVEEMCPISCTDNDCTIQGFIGLPENTRHNRTGQYLFINNRAIVSPLIGFAIRNGYSTSLPPQRHPIYVLHLRIPEELVDVNVHPQKREVRLRQEQLLKERITYWIGKALVERGISTVSSENWNVDPLKTLENRSTHFSFAPITDLSTDTESPPFFILPETSYEPLKPLETVDPPLLHSYRPMENQKRSTLPLSRSFQDRELDLPKTLSAKYRAPYVMGTMKNYLIVDGDGANYGEGVWIVDQKRAHARIVYDQFLERNKKSAVQTLLLPYPLVITPTESTLLEEHLELLSETGIQVRQVGPSNFLVDALPQILDGIDIPGLISELLVSFQESQSSSVLQNEYYKKMAQVAGRLVMTKDQELSKEEGQRLLVQLMQSSNPYHCPVGKPIFARFTLHELERKFCK